MMLGLCISPRQVNSITLVMPMGGASVNIKLSILVVTGLLLTSVTAQAVPVTVNLGQSAEHFVEYGLGPNSDNLGTYATRVPRSPAGNGIRVRSDRVLLRALRWRLPGRSAVLEAAVSALVSTQPWSGAVRMPEPAAKESEPGCRHCRATSPHPSHCPSGEKKLVRPLAAVSCVHATQSTRSSLAPATTMSSVAIVPHWPTTARQLLP